jgi:hypothetical protein
MPYIQAQMKSADVGTEKPRHLYVLRGEATGLRLLLIAALKILQQPRYAILKRGGVWKLAIIRLHFAQAGY